MSYGNLPIYFLTRIIPSSFDYREFFSRKIKSLAAKLALSQSDLITKAFDAYRESQKKQKVEEMAQIMADEYRDNSELVALTALDSEDSR